MTAPRRTGGLGRGLGALIPTSAADVDATSSTLPSLSSAHFADVPLDRITPNAHQPRVNFDPEALAELVTSIREVGLLQPVVVRQVSEDADGPRYELVMGERRWRASQVAETGTIPAIVRATADDDLLRDALLENLHRQQLNPLEEAAAYAQLLGDFGATHEQLAERIGRSRPQITNMLRLLQLPAAVQRRVAAGVLSAGHAKALLSLPTPEAQEEMALRVVAEGLSVRGVEEAVQLAQSQGEPRAARGGRAKRPQPQGLVELADRLSDRFETRVKVDMGRAKGKVTIEFATLDDLHRIVAMLEPSRES